MKINSMEEKQFQIAEEKIEQLERPKNVGTENRSLSSHSSIYWFENRSTNLINSVAHSIDYLECAREKPKFSRFLLKTDQSWENSL